MKELRKFAELAFSPTKHLLARKRQTGQPLGKKLNQEDIDAVAKEAFAWAQSNGVTHYTFWVQPLTNKTI